MNTKRQSIYQQRIRNVLTFIEKNANRKMSLSELAKVSCFSDYHFHRIFKTVVGESVKEHIRRIRLEKACRLLGCSNDSIAEVAKQSGFNSHESFIRAFKKQFGFLPSGSRAIFKKSLKNNIHKPVTSILESTSQAEVNALCKHVSVKHIDPCNVLYVRRIGPYQHANSVWLTLMSEVGSDMFFDSSLQKLAITHDIPGVTPDEKLRYDACIEIKDQGKENESLDDEIDQKTLKGGLYSCYQYSQADGTIDDAINKVISIWLPYSEYEPRHEPVRYYCKNFDKTATAFADPIVEICIPIKPIEE